MEQIRLLNANEIDVKAQTFTEKGGVYVLYKDSRVDMNILDETFGSLNWQKKHFSMDGKMFCTISIYNPETKEWIEKTDCGAVESGAAEAIRSKAEISDSFKRAAVVVGIGRELYTAPFIWIPASKLTMTTDKKGKPTSRDELKVTDIEYTNRKISFLQIVNTKSGEIAFTAGKKSTEIKGGSNGKPPAKPSEPKPQSNKATASKAEPEAPKESDGRISVTDAPDEPQEDFYVPATSNTTVSPGDFVIPVGYAKGQTISTFYLKNKDAVMKKKGDDFAKIDVFEWYNTNLKGKAEFKTFLEAIIQYCVA